MQFRFLTTALAGLAFAATSARAALVQTKVSSATELAYSAEISSSDLLTGKTAITTGWNPGNGSTTAELNDGIHGRSFATAGNSVEGTWTTIGATAIYNLGLGANSLGYDIASIQTIAAWNGAAFGNQGYTVDVKFKGAGSYTTLATVDYQPLAAGGIGATSVTLTDSSGVLASGVESIRFTANSINGGANVGAFVFREIDVFGTPTGLDSVLPQISIFSPADDANDVLVGSHLVATFNENIARGSGNITIKNLSDSTQTVIPVGNAQVLVSGAVLTINLTGNLAALKNYAIRIDSGAITDLSGNPFSGIADDTSWNFTTIPTPLRIMCLGDSITAGYTDNPTWNHPFKFGYRSGLYTRLTNAGYNFRFVGASTEPWTGISGDPTLGGTYTPALDLRTFGQDGHRGYGGKNISFINGAVAGYIAADTPDVILLLIGINGIGSGSPASLNTLVNTIVTAAPNARLIVAQITPLASFNQNLYNYNIYIRDTLVPSYVAAGKKVSTVNLYSLFLTNPNDYSSAIAPNVLSNGINHPDNLHYDLMAQEWFKGIGSLGLGPVDHFVISGISSPKTAGTAITGITITAKDAANNTATGFTGTVTFGGTAGCTGTSAAFVAGVLNGVSVTPTVAGSNLTLTVNDGAAHIGSTTLATVLTPFASWASGGAIAADANNDGVANGVAWVLGATNPSANTLGLLPTLDNTTDPNYFIYTYRRSDAANADINTTIAVQYDSDLSGWTNAVHDGTNIIITPNNDGAGESVDLVQVRIKRTLAVGGRLFCRLNVVIAP